MDPARRSRRPPVAPDDQEVEGGSTEITVSGPLLPRTLVVLLGLASAVIVVAGMRGVSSLLGPLFLALVIAIAAQPLRNWLDRYLPTWAATLACLLVVNLLLVALAVSLVAATARFATLLPDYQEQFNQWVADVVAQFHHLGVSSEQIDHIADSLDLSKLTGLLTDVVSGVLGIASSLVFIVALILFMTIDGSQFPRHLREAAGVRPGLVEALTSFARGTRRYLLVSTVFGLIVAVLDTGALALLDIPAPVLWGLLAFLTNYIPNIGFIIGLVPPAVLGLLEGGPGLSLTVVVVYCVFNVIIQSVIQPKVVGDAVGLSTTLTFLSLVFWSWVIGPLGAILAIPLSLLARSLLVDVDPANRWLTPLIANSDQTPAVTGTGGPGDDAGADMPSPP